MFGTLGGPEVILILVIALIVFGPRKLPEIGKSMGKMLAEFRKASNDFKRTIEDELEAEKTKDTRPVTTVTTLPPPESGAAPAEPEAAGYGGAVPVATDATADAAPAAPLPSAPEPEGSPVTASDAPASSTVASPAEPTVSRGSADEK